jgi:predicted ATPase
MLVAETLGLPAKANLTSEDIVNFIADSYRLLILDNFEQLLPKQLPFLTDLLRCPNLRTLVTSREVLNLKHEHHFRLGHLAYPTEEVTLEEARTYAAVRLFEGSANPYNLVLTDKNLPHVLRLCQWVEGLPLALKLVTPWLSTLSLEQLGSAVGKLELLSQGSYDTPRHQSIQVAFDYSLELLSKSQREAFVSLAVFEGGFSLEAATALGVPVTTLRSLVEKSLLRFETETTRYSFHPLLHQYARGLLERETQVHEVKTKHANFYFGLLDGLFDEEGNEETKLLSQLRLELQNVESAWRYATDNKWYEQLFKSAKSLQRFGDLAAQYTVADILLSYSLETLASLPVTTKVALTCNLSAIKYHRGNYERAVELAKEALELLPTSNVEPERELSIKRLIFSTMQLSYSCLGQFEESLHVAYQTYEMLRERVPDTLAYAEALTHLAIAERDVLGRYEIDHLTEALMIAENKAKPSVPWILIQIANSFIRSGKLQEATEILLRSQTLAQEMALEKRGRRIILA